VPIDNNQVFAKYEDLIQRTDGHPNGLVYTRQKGQRRHDLGQIHFLS
jgi:hypothetical protein